MRNSETKLNNKQQKLNSNDILCAFQIFLFAKLQLHMRCVYIALLYQLWTIFDLLGCYLYMICVLIND